jgi:hypothetical protein
MFDIANEKEERLRGAWYAPIGEYVLLFSNLEFTLSSWIGLLSTSRATRNVGSKLKLAERLELLLDLVDEQQVDKKTKEKWRNEWLKIKPLTTTRNLICHNPPINNFSIVLNNGSVSIKPKTVEVLTLKKPIGEPGSGLSLATLKKQIQTLREILICLDELEDEENVRRSTQ